MGLAGRGARGLLIVAIAAGLLLAFAGAAQANQYVVDGGFEAQNPQTNADPPWVRSDSHFGGNSPICNTRCYSANYPPRHNGTDGFAWFGGWGQVDENSTNTELFTQNLQQTFNTPALNNAVYSFYLYREAFEQPDTSLSAIFDGTTLWTVNAANEATYPSAWTLVSLPVGAVTAGSHTVQLAMTQTHHDDDFTTNLWIDDIAFNGDPVPPAAPSLTATNPASSSNDNHPLITGSEALGNTISLYDTSGCTGTPVATGTAASLDSTGIAVDVANNSDTTFYATATDTFNDVSICSASGIEYQESTPAPDPPSFSGTDPPSGGNDNQPDIQGSAPDGTTVTLYTTPDCSGDPAASGTAAAFASTGLPVSVGDNTTTTFYGSDSGATEQVDGTSGCSPTSITYVENTPPDPPIFTGSNPPSFSDDTNPAIQGSAEAGSTVDLYTTPDCSDLAPAGTGDAATFGSTGIEVTVADDSTTTFYATATDSHGTSVCSPTSYTYAEATPPDTPILTGTDPASGANNNNPHVEGTAPAGTTVKLYESADCSGSPVATGSAADFAVPGLAVEVADNSTTTFHATASNNNATSTCSSSSVTYTEATPPPPPNTGGGGTTPPPTSSKKKCKKHGKKKCKKPKKH